MRLLLVDESGAIAQEYEGVTAQADGTAVRAKVLTVVIPGETEEPPSVPENHGLWPWERPCARLRNNGEWPL